MRGKIFLYSTKQSRVIWLHIGFIIIGIMLLSRLFACNASVAEDIALKAYELRLDGKVDEAKSLLEEHLADNSDDANANCELSRIYLYTGIGNPQELKNSIENAKQYIDKAIKLDSENIAYRNFAGKVAFIKAYMAMQGGGEGAKVLVEDLCSVYESILDLQPEYWVASMYLAEIYSGLPEEMGGDPAKAEEYVKRLEQYDEVIGAKARVFLMSEDADYIEFWKKILEKHQNNAMVLEELGKTYLRMGKTEDGIKYIQDAMEVNPDLSLLHLDIARYYIYNIMADKNLMESHLPLAEAAFNDYLATDPIPPMKAYAIGWLAQLKFRSKDKEGGENLAKQAEAIDPYYSKATAIPGQDLFVPPGEVSYNHSYLFQPF